jgi:hypothetical protein
MAYLMGKPRATNHLSVRSPPGVSPTRPRAVHCATPSASFPDVQARYVAKSGTRTIFAPDDIGAYSIDDYGTFRGEGSCHMDKAAY